jgi:hypothetical protein
MTVSIALSRDELILDTGCLPVCFNFLLPFYLMVELSCRTGAKKTLYNKGTAIIDHQS